MAAFNDTLHSIVREAQREWLADVEIYDPEIALEMGIAEAYKAESLSLLMLKLSLLGPAVEIRVEGE